MQTWNPDPNQTALDIADRRAVRDAVRDFLLERGAERGATTSELVARFGMSAVKRLNDLRKDPTEPWDYAPPERISRTEYRYRLVKKEPERWPVLEMPSEGLLFSLPIGPMLGLTLHPLLAIGVLVAVIAAIATVLTLAMFRSAAVADRERSISRKRLEDLQREAHERALSIRRVK